MMKEPMQQTERHLRAEKRISRIRALKCAIFERGLDVDDDPQVKGAIKDLWIAINKIDGQEKQILRL